MFTGTNVDRRGVSRGACRECPEDCDQYSQPISRDSCDYCGCPAGRHERWAGTPCPPIKQEPDDEDDEVTEVRPRPGPSGQGVSSRQRAPAPTPPTNRQQANRPQPQQKLCKQLLEMKIAYPPKIPKNVVGVFAISYRKKVIYVGEPKKTPIQKQYNAIFSGSQKQDIGKFFSKLPERDRREQVTVAWIKNSDEPHRRACGKTFRSCIADLQGDKPRDLLKLALRKL